jgi:hypothetical protein
MEFIRIPSPAILCAALLLAASVPAHSQSAEPKDQRAGDAVKDHKKIDEFAEALRVLGGPAAHPECVWLGRRVISLMVRDDMDTAFRHLDLYDRFGCPGGHIQASFRCLLRQPEPDPKAPESIRTRAHACWVNPTMELPAHAAQPSGTKPQ